MQNAFDPFLRLFKILIELLKSPGPTSTLKANSYPKAPIKSKQELKCLKDIKPQGKHFHPKRKE
jgi:hypothetical protein